MNKDRRKTVELAGALTLAYGENSVPGSVRRVLDDVLDEMIMVESKAVTAMKPHADKPQTEANMRVAELAIDHLTEARHMILEGDNMAAAELLYTVALKDMPKPRVTKRTAAATRTKRTVSARKAGK